LLLAIRTNGRILEAFEDIEHIRLPWKELILNQLKRLWWRFINGFARGASHGGSARSLLESMFFDARRYDLAKVGRYKLNKKLHPDIPRMSAISRRKILLLP
jgi:DNA-directed RNA polymerase subunit beta